MVKRVLLVEDDSDDRDLFVAFFGHRKDISLMPALHNGLELIEHLSKITTEQELPDLIVLDQNMPLVNGKQSLQYLKSHERFSKIPVVIYSTYADSDLVVDCKKLGASMVAGKPIDHEGYQKMMDDFLRIV
jgi:CheY-like chemotaxis protein